MKRLLPLILLAGCATRPSIEQPPATIVVETTPGVYLVREGVLDAQGCRFYPKVDGRDGYPEGKNMTLCPVVKP